MTISRFRTQESDYRYPNITRAEARVLWLSVPASAPFSRPPSDERSHSTAGLCVGAEAETNKRMQTRDGVSIVTRIHAKPWFLQSDALIGAVRMYSTRVR